MRVHGDGTRAVTVTTADRRAIRESSLYRDLELDHRDAMVRAATFIARHGGPPVPGDTMDALRAHREPAKAWLLAQEGPGPLLADYDRFLEHWSPVFLR
jgi:hypothetical protein